MSSKCFDFICTDETEIVEMAICRTFTAISVLCYNNISS